MMQHQQPVDRRSGAPQGSENGIPSASSTTCPVRIPEASILPYSRLSLRAYSGSSISPSPNQRILATGSPGQDDALSAQQGFQGAALPALAGGQQAPMYPRLSRPYEGAPNKRPPLPPSPQARLPGGAGSLNPLAPAWINPADSTGSGSGSAGRQPRLLSAASGSVGSYGDTGLLAAAAASGSSTARPSHSQLPGQYACGSPLGSASLSPGGEGLLGAAVSSEEVAVAAGNPYHPQHESAMQLLLDHQHQQLQQLQQQHRGQQAAAGSSSGGNRTPRQYLRASSFGTGGMSQQSPRASPRSFSHSSSYNRLSELGTSPGLIEANFMGMAARSHTQPSSTSRSATLQQLMQQEQAAIRAQQEEQQRALQHSRSTVSFSEWGGHTGGSGAGSTADPSSQHGSRPSTASTQQPLSLPAVPQDLPWDVAQQQQEVLRQGIPPLIPRVSQGPGMKVLPGRVGLHWLSRADDRESAARGLLGLPRPGLRTLSPRVQRGLAEQRALPPLSPRVQRGSAEHRALSALSPRVQRGGQLPPAGGPGQPAPGAGDDSLPAAETQQQQQQHQAPGDLVAWFAATLPAMEPDARSRSSSSPRGLRTSRSFGRQSSINTLPRDRSSSNGADVLRSMSLSRNASYVGMPTCLICLDQLTSADFESGEAMYLACRCKGEVALRHRQCAEKWTRIKGNTICDVCKAPILNLPEVPPLPAPPPPPAADDRLFQGSGLWGPLGDEPPAVADYVFDCIRVTWVVLIVCILFFELSVTHAFVTGTAVGLVYVALSASLASCRRWRQRRRLQQEGSMVNAWLLHPQAQDRRVFLLPV